MKKMKNIAWVVFFLLMAFTAKAAGEVQIEIREDHTLIVQLKAADMGTVLLLQDQDGTVFFKDSLLTYKPYKTSLDLKPLPEGSYSLIIEGDFSIRSWTLEKAEDIKLRKDMPEILYKPQYKLSDDQVKVFMSNPWETETSMRVYDSTGEVVGLSGDKKSTFQRILNFSGVPPGLYTIHIKSANRSYLKTVEIIPKNDLGRISMVVGAGF